MLQHPVPEKLLARIGDVTVSFALLELEIQMAVHTLLGRGQFIGEVVTAEVAFRQLRALATGLYRERFGEDADFETLRDLMKRAGELELKRNQITHSIWAAGETEETVTRIKTTAKEKRGRHTEFVLKVSEEDLTGIASDLKELAHDVQRFWIALVEAGKV